MEQFKLTTLVGKIEEFQQELGYTYDPDLNYTLSEPFPLYTYFLYDHDQVRRVFDHLLADFLYCPERIDGPNDPTEG